MQEKSTNNILLYNNDRWLLSKKMLVNMDEKI